MTKRYWLTPPDLYERLNAEFGFTFDPCPYPLPEGHNGLEMPWGAVNYVNPPFRRKDAVGKNAGPTAFVHKAIAEAKLGKTSVLVLPGQSYFMLGLENGAELRSAGRVKFLEVETREPYKSPSAIFTMIFRGKP